MKDETSQLLDDILGAWHNYCSNFRAIQQVTTSPMFAGVRNNRQWDAENEINEDLAHKSTMKAVDFHIGELQPVYRTALCINARNIATGKSVWFSARLPVDQMARAEVVFMARSALLSRLRDAGIL